MTGEYTAYQGLSRTHRPQTFADVLGQEAVVTTFKNAISKKKTAAAYLLCGTRGTGKTTLARIIAKALNCPHLSAESEPCNLCPSCLSITAGNNLNVFEIDGASNRGIEDIRSLQEHIDFSPRENGYKIFILDEAHMLTKEAFNALLKTLEEPPPRVKFFLATTEPHKIPPTITSRCQRFDLQRIQQKQIVAKLAFMLQAQHVSYQEAALYQIASISDGSLRVAESTLDQILCLGDACITENTLSQVLGIRSREEFFAFDQAFAKGDFPFAFTWAQKIFSSGSDLPHFLDSLLEHYNHILHCHLQLPLEDLSPESTDQYAQSALFYTQEQCFYLMEYLVEWQQKLAKFPFPRTALEMVLLHILRSKDRVTAAELVYRLEQLQGGTPCAKPMPIEKAPSKPPIQTEKVLYEAPSPTPSSSAGGSEQARRDTFIRFAAVELEGTIH